MKTTPRTAILIDDAWRYEKADILRFLAAQLDFDVLTHDVMTAELLDSEFTVHRLPVTPPRKWGVYPFLMFFARELDTHMVRYRQKIKIAARGPLAQAFHGLRNLAGRLGLRRYTYTRTLEWYYRNSHLHDDLLGRYHTLVYMPVFAADKRVIFEARAMGCRVCCWVYSWDNPFKDNEFPADADCYLVWNAFTRKDLCRLHAVPESRTRIVGPAQLDYLREIDWSGIVPPMERYVLYACAMGLDEMLAQEVQMIRNIRSVLDEVAPEVALYVRPYPNRKQIDGYASLFDVPGITMLDFGRVEDGRILITAEDLVERIVQIHNAACFINLGSTIGLEAAYTDTPILQLDYSIPNDYPAYLDLCEPLKNEHLKYLIRDDCPNTIRSDDELRMAMACILRGETKPYRPYSKRLRAFSDPLPETDSYRHVLLEALQKLEVEALGNEDMPV